MNSNKIEILLEGDCLELMKEIPDESVDMIFADLPFGTTYQKWDKIINFNLLWKQYRRIAKNDAAIVLYASQPFTTLLIYSALDIFRYTWVWDKVNPTNFPNANINPLKQHEDICVFYKQQCKYYPQKVKGNINHKQGKSKLNISETRLIKERVEDDLSGLKFPKSILCYPKHSSQCKLHPNQKLISLSEYLIKTYTDEYDIVLDNVAGSGTTGEACRNINRNFILIEKSHENCEIIRNRLSIN